MKRKQNKTFLDDQNTSLLLSYVQSNECIFIFQMFKYISISVVEC